MQTGSRARSEVGGELAAKRQRAGKIGELCKQADAVSWLAQTKLERLCAAHGGEFHGADVESEDWALRKVHRS